MDGKAKKRNKSKKPLPPRGLSPEAKAEWGRIVGELVKRGTISKSDRSIILVYVQNWEVNQKAAAEVAVGGAVVACPHNGVIGRSPHYTVMKETSQIIRRLLAEMKMTPATRPKEEEEEELDI